MQRKEEERDWMVGALIWGFQVGLVGLVLLGMVAVAWGIAWLAGVVI